jgi:hypothetical protein
MPARADRGISIYAVKTSIVVSKSRLVCLMMEKPDVLLDERDAQLLGRLKDGSVVLAARWGSDVFGS